MFGIDLIYVSFSITFSDLGHSTDLKMFYLNIYAPVDTIPPIMVKLNVNVKFASPVDTGRKLNVHKTFRRRPGRLLNVLCTFNLRSVSAAGVYFLF